MSDNDELANQIGELIEESARPVTLEEVEARAGTFGTSLASRRWRRVGVGAVSIVLLVAAIALVATRGSGDKNAVTTPAPTGAASATSTTPPSIPKSVARGVVPYDSLTRVARSAVHAVALPAGIDPISGLVIDGSFWFTGSKNGCHQGPSCFALYRADPGSDRAVRMSGEGFFGGDSSAYGEGGVWELSAQLDGSPYHVTLVDPTTGKAKLDVALPNTHVYGDTTPNGQIAVGGGAVWVTEGDSSAETLVKLDPATGAVLSTITLPDAAFGGLGVNADGVWTAGYGGTGIIHVAPSTLHASLLKSFGQGFTQSIAVTDDAVWATHEVDGAKAFAPRQLSLVRIEANDPSKVTSYGLPTTDVVAGGGGVWFLGYESPTSEFPPYSHHGAVGRIDPRTMRVVGMTELPIGYIDSTQLAVSGHTAWVIDSSTHTLTTIDVN